MMNKFIIVDLLKGSSRMRNICETKGGYFMKLLLRFSLVVLIVLFLNPLSHGLVVDAGGPYDIWEEDNLSLTGYADEPVWASWTWQSSPTSLPYLLGNGLSLLVPWTGVLDNRGYNGIITLTATDQNNASTVSDTAPYEVHERIVWAEFYCFPTHLGSALTLDASISRTDQINGWPTIVDRRWDLNPSSDYNSYAQEWSGFAADFITDSPILTLTPEQYASFFPSPGTYHPGLEVIDSSSRRGFGQSEITILAPVPIPPSVWLLGSGLVGLVGLRRKFMSYLKNKLSTIRYIFIWKNDFMDETRAPPI